MVSRDSPNSVGKALSEQVPAQYSPLEKTPHKAAVVGDGGAVSAAGTFIDMAAQSGGATMRNGQQDLDMGPADPLTAALDEAVPAARTRSATSRGGRLI
jgi:hypothetical protein